LEFVVLDLVFVAIPAEKPDAVRLKGRGGSQPVSEKLNHGFGDLARRCRFLRQERIPPDQVVLKASPPSIGPGRASPLKRRAVLGSSGPGYQDQSYEAAGREDAASL
jgi:hypothetical protein